MLRWAWVLWGVLMLWGACEAPTPKSEPGAPEQVPDAGREPLSDAPRPVERVRPRDVGPLKTVFGGDRPVKLRAPADYDPGTSYPLLVVLHGYGATGQLQSFYLGVNPLVESQQLLLLAPDGTKDPSDKRFWNATDACCDFSGSGVDDVAYLKGLIEEVKQAYNVDSRRVYLIGHSNGGYMSFRMACDAAPLIAGIVALAGATRAKKSDCKPQSTVSVLAIHGTLDDSVKYEGESDRRHYPGAVQTATYWGEYNKCTGTLEATSARLDLDGKLEGKETEVRVFSGCPKGLDVRLWTIREGLHLPAIRPDFATQVWAWMKAHPKP